MRSSKVTSAWLHKKPKLLNARNNILCIEIKLRYIWAATSLAAKPNLLLDETFHLQQRRYHTLKDSHVPLLLQVPCSVHEHCCCQARVVVCVSRTCSRLLNPVIWPITDAPHTCISKEQCRHKRTIVSCSELNSTHMVLLGQLHAASLSAVRILLSTISHAKKLCFPSASTFHIACASKLQ